jgi:hypothetical protein
LQKQRDELIGKIESKTPKMLDSDAIVAYAKELAYILSESSFLQRKTFLRTFIQKIEVNPENVIVDYTLPIPMNKDRTSTKEVLYINRIGSPSRIRTRDFAQALNSRLAVVHFFL